MLQLQHLVSAACAALIIHCKCRDAYDFFFIWSINVYAVLQCTLNKRLFSAPVHAGLG